jgi:hypothetical protein
VATLARSRIRGAEECAPRTLGRAGIVLRPEKGKDTDLELDVSDRHEFAFVMRGRARVAQGDTSGLKLEWPNAQCWYGVECRPISDAVTLF